MKLSVIISSLLLYSRPTLALAVSKSTTRSPQVTPLAKREDVPTLTIDPITKYFPSGASSPQPSGTSLQIFPTGIYDNVPEDGLTVALGPELRKQINDAASSKCNSQSFAQECEDVLVSIIQQTDLQPHTKRFGPAVIGLLALGALIGVIMQEQRIHSIGAEIPETLHLSPGDVAKVVSMSDAATFAVTQIGATTTPYTVTWKPAPTSTSPNFITIETLPVDKDDHKAGDIVYRIPKDAAQRISDFLAITGIQDTQNICKGHNMRRADPVQECLQRIQRHAMDLVDTGPANLLQIAQQNIPARPPAGQAIGFPIEMIANEGIPLLIPVYRVVVAHAPPRPDLDMGWDPVVLAKSATAITIAAHAAIFVGQSILEMWIPKDKLTPDLREDRLSCPKDMLCVDDECQGQKEDTNIVGVRPYCKKARHSWRCICAWTWC
ncbi:hypothetical protein BDU57DRAFT_124308 [Ampelomyces quisqualis]|uniref:Uncharacterized protein n=1 Tax=Ampelomyces quisqualis TaxID=50730 RepID=A0A6A5QU40_AMPQU|nr:hypothetical protein BDU57DRAFT_124308 [Ampelomyces quisqualis]